MNEPGPERRLAAVVAADMVGYSRLMEADDTGSSHVSRPIGSSSSIRLSRRTGAA
jgi:hypothetical protein